MKFKVFNVLRLLQIYSLYPIFTSIVLLVLNPNVSSDEHSLVKPGIHDCEVHGCSSSPRFYPACEQKGTGIQPSTISVRFYLDRS